MVGKTPLILAPLILGAALLCFTFWLGRIWERAGKRYAASFIDPATHGELMETVRQILQPVDVDHACFLPASVQDKAVKVLARADEQAARRARVELRRRGF